MSARLYRLMSVHQRIDEALRHEQRRRAPDGFAVMRLKRLKLRTKDLIARTMRSPRLAG